MLGVPRVSVDGDALDLKGRPLHLLLRLVVGRGQPIPPARLGHDIWDGDSDGAVRVNLSRLRKAVGDDVVVRVGAGHALADSIVDADRFETLIERARDRDATITERIRTYDEAIGLWRGPAFDSIDPYPWLITEINRLEALREQATDEHLELRSLVEEPARLVPDLVEALDRAPLRERRAELLAEALYRSNRQSEALATIDRTRTLLRDQLGLDPGPALRDLEHRILTHDESLLITPRTIRESIAPDIAGLIRAATALIRTGAYAEGAGILDDAEAMARRAADQRSLAECLVTRSLHHSMSGSGDPHGPLDEARRIARRLRDGPLLAKVAGVAFGQGASPEIRSGLVELMEPLELLPSNASARVDLLCAAAVMVTLTSGSAAAELLLKNAAELHDTIQTERSGAVLAAARCVVGAGAGAPVEELERRAYESLDFARTGDDPMLAVVASHALMRSLYARGDLDAVDELLGPLLSAGRSAMMPFAIARVGVCRVMHAIARGHFELADALLEELDATADLLRTINTPRAAMAQRTLLALERGHVESYAESIRGEYEAGIDHPQAMGLLLVLAGGLDEDPMTLVEQLPADATRIPSIAVAALVALELGDRNLAAFCVTEFESMPDVVLATGLGTLLFGFVPHLRGSLRLELDDVDGAIGDLERALELTEPSGAQLWLDHLRTDLALALQRRNAPGDLGRAEELRGAVQAGPLLSVSARLARRFARLG